MNKKSAPQKKRRSRYHEDTDQPPPMRVQDRDIDLIKYVHQHRFLTTQHLVLLLFGVACLASKEKYHSCLKVVQRRLNKLWHNRYLARKRMPVMIGQGSGQAVYMLNTNGADLLSSQTSEDPQEIIWTQKQNEAGEHYIQHALMCSDHLVVLQTACKHPNYGQIEYLDHGHGKSLHHSFTVEDAQGQDLKLHVRPDWFFVLKDHRFDNTPSIYCFLEADRSTMDHKRMASKFMGYAFYRRYQMHKRLLNIPEFRVLTITRSDHRRQGLRNLVYNLDLPNLTDRDKRNLFWFATEQSYRLNEPGRIFAPIWQTGVPDDLDRGPSEEDRRWSLIKPKT